jgi:hypothetical protein
MLSDGNHLSSWMFCCINAFDLSRQPFGRKQRRITNPECRMSNKEFRMMKFDGFVKSPKTPFSVIPVKTGIQEIQELLDSRLRGSDDYGDFLRDHQV